jgi:hypothetical protein
MFLCRRVGKKKYELLYQYTFGIKGKCLISLMNIGIGSLACKGHDLVIIPTVNTLVGKEVYFLEYKSLHYLKISKSNL